ncbi:MAG: beta-glucosidase [Longicatena sp.]
MKWKLIHKNNCDQIENDGGKKLSYHPNLGIQIIERDGYAFKDLDNSGELNPFEDWRNPMSVRVKDFKNRFNIWQEDDCLYYRKGKIFMPDDLQSITKIFQNQEVLKKIIVVKEKDIAYLEKNYIFVLLLLMFDNDNGTGKEDYLLSLMVQSMELGLLENIVYSIWEALHNYIKSTRSLLLQCAI